MHYLGSYFVEIPMVKLHRTCTIYCPSSDTLSPEIITKCYHIALGHLNFVSSCTAYKELYMHRYRNYLFMKNFNISLLKCIKTDKYLTEKLLS